jgi:hypothetical protein
MKKNILAQVHAHTGTHTEQASRLIISMPTLRPTVRNDVEIERSFVQCGPSSMQQKSLKCSPLQNWNLLLLHGSSKHMQVMLPQVAPTSRRRAYISLLIWK